MKFLTLYIVLLVTFSAIASADIIKSGSLRAQSDGSNVTIQWITEQEAGVLEFVVERRSGTEGAFQSIGTINPKGASIYEFIDYSAFRKVGSLYQYRVAVKMADNSVSYSLPITVSHTVSGVRRTWGSIKSLFR